MFVNLILKIIFARGAIEMDLKYLTGLILVMKKKINIIKIKRKKYFFRSLIL